MIAQQGSLPFQKLNTPYPPRFVTYFKAIVEKSNTLEPSLFLLGEQGSLFHVELKSSPLWVK